MEINHFSNIFIGVKVNIFHHISISEFHSPNSLRCVFLQVILALIMLFIASWGTSIISVNYFNYNRGSSAEFLLVIARFANIIFIAMSPAVLAIGHRRLRSFIKSTLAQ